ncbi:alanine--tRNA ligase [Gynurincola endophyticus]|uniref:alanine--tRNA ligase n=1 Tax=Gynurincola endophyticus TaxID=2479004 RepID=UPI000F8C92AC|nr:alanine--tRNA ligase [Gynurincola endophyticus]
MSTAGIIRQQFLDFFSSKGHQIVPSAPIVVKNDPTLLFTNAGMNQFKDYFLGNKKAPFTRVADTQKCLRVSGKHNDLEEVGVDTYHHTMFEMLGNWSFGDYFKTEAIAWSWELLTEVYKLPKDRLYVTVFGGDTKENLPVDEEAKQEWLKWIDADRILLGSKKDNFWEMGDTGPCGPCTEIHVDCRPDNERKLVDGKTLVNNDHPQVIEIWNNVFIQFNRLKDGNLEPLPNKHVDTGMGFERLVRVLQAKTSNYDTDVFSHTIQLIEKITGIPYKATEANPAANKRSEQENIDVAIRVLSDHIRAICFTIADGQLPSNTGAGYVVRRILRRAVRYYYSTLQYKQPLLFQLVPELAAQFVTVFPELKQQESFVEKVIKEEEEAFLRTLDKGLKKIDDLIQNSTNTIEGKAAFELYDTFGFPLDLTKLIAQEKGLSVDEKGFEVEMQAQKDRSRAATTLDTEDWAIVGEETPVKFIGYTDTSVNTHVIKYRKVTAKNKTSYQLVLATTPFYAESGGQVGDTGTLNFDGELIEVTNTKKENDLIIHFTDKLPQNPAAKVFAEIDTHRRLKTTLHHSATHLMHAALRKVLGEHVAQKGSLVNDEYLRFDFSHFSKVSDEELLQVEQIVNEAVRANYPVVIKEMPKDEAIALGAMALFGEKYGDLVRVVVMNPAFSIELCGGTHVASTGEIGLFKIKSEGAVAAGVRRIEAFTGVAAEQFVQQQLEELKQVKAALKQPKELLKAVEQIQQELSAAKKQLEAAENKLLDSERVTLAQKAVTINGIAFIGEQLSVNNPDALKKLAHDLKQDHAQLVAVLVANIGGKAAVAISIDEKTAAEKGLDAGQLIKQVVAPLIKGGGGGQKTLATAGGQNADQLQDVINNIREKI